MQPIDCFYKKVQRPVKCCWLFTANTESCIFTTSMKKNFAILFFLLRDFGKVATLLKNKNPNNGI